MQKFKNIIIGFGKGGKTLAKKLAASNEEVLVIETSAEMYGGTCINVGCIPSKKMITGAERHVDYVDALQAKRTLISKLRDKNFHMIADEATAQVWHATARFVADHTLQVTFADGQEETIEGERIFINTGATSVIPNIEGLILSDNVITSKEALDLADKPEHLIVLGAGYIGLEFASMYRKYGTEVTVIDTQETFMPREDKDIAQLVYNDLVADGIDFRLGSENISVAEKDNQVYVTYSKFGHAHVIKADKVLVATGRRANTDALGLENTHIETDQFGAIQVNEYLQTGVDNVWALGDVKGGPQFTYVSLDDYRIVADQLFGKSERTTANRPVLPYTVFLTPPMSRVGLSEAQAKAQALSYQVYQLPVAAIPKANILGETRGLFKVIVDTQTQLILGATLYGTASQEMINLLVLAMNAQVPYTVLRDQLYTHPTMSESFNDLFK